MSRPAQGTLPAMLAISMAAAATTLAAMLSWGGFVELSLPYLLPLTLLGLVVAGSGAFARWWRLPTVVVVAAQLVLSFMAFSLVTVGTPLPLGSGWAALITEFANAGESARLYPSPVPSSAAASTDSPRLAASGMLCASNNSAPVNSGNRMGKINA